jgi:hypothetical protein
MSTESTRFDEAWRLSEPSAPLAMYKLLLPLSNDSSRRSRRLTTASHRLRALQKRPYFLAGWHP